MTGDSLLIDRLLAAVLRGDEAAWPAVWNGRDQAALVTERIAYHGIVGLIAERAPALAGWPTAVLSPAREQAIALAMWELRHKEVLGELLAALASGKIVALLLKGTALAYDLYPVPATRARGDSDLLIAAADVDAARSVLSQLGYRRQPLDEAIADDLELQEVWSLVCDAGTEHHIDLHWQLLNAPALGDVLTFDTCGADQRRLPRLSADTLAMNRVLTLLHSCIHRAMHLTSPYFVDGVTYYGGDRLIWAKDIDLLASALSDAEWDHFAALALDQRVAAVSFDGMMMAQRWLRTEIPQRVLDTLGTAGAERPSAYLLGARQLGRAWQDFRAIRGVDRKLAYLAARALPSAQFMRAKYPRAGHVPVALLHIKRMVDLFRQRPERNSGR